MIPPLLPLTGSPIRVRDNRRGVPGRKRQLHPRPQGGFYRTFLQEEGNVRHGRSSPVSPGHQRRIQCTPQETTFQSFKYSPYLQRSPSGSLCAPLNPGNGARRGTGHGEMETPDIGNNRPEDNSCCRSIDTSIKEKVGSEEVFYQGKFGEFQKKGIISLPVRRFSSFTPFPGIFRAESALFSHSPYARFTHDSKKKRRPLSSRVRRGRRNPA